MARPKIPVPNRRRLNVHAKSQGPTSNFAITKPGGVCCYKSKT